MAAQVAVVVVTALTLVEQVFLVKVMLAALVLVALLLVAAADQVRLEAPEVQTAMLVALVQHLQLAVHLPITQEAEVVATPVLVAALVALVVLGVEALVMLNPVVLVLQTQAAAVVVKQVLLLAHALVVMVALA
jgi:hypothetical protein